MKASSMERYMKGTTLPNGEVVQRVLKWGDKRTIVTDKGRRTIPVAEAVTVLHQSLREDAVKTALDSMTRHRDGSVTLRWGPTTNKQTKRYSSEGRATAALLKRYGTK